MLDSLDKDMLEEMAGFHELPIGAYNIRKNGEKAARNITANIDILTKKDKPGIDVIIKPGTKGESVHIPVLITKEGLEDVVYNSFEIGEGSDVLIVAGCGIHNPGDSDSQHDGIHEFFVRKGAKVKYVEKHFGEGDGLGKRILNPKTLIEVEEGGTAEIEMVQIKGVDSTLRDTKVKLHKGAKLIVVERLLTHGKQVADSIIDVELLEEDSSAQIISRSVAQNKSSQAFHLNMSGYAKCAGHIQCDSIIMHDANVQSIPRISAFHSDAQLIHEAAIGKIANEQLLKLMTLGLNEKEAEDTILKGFLK
ncbi:MAG: SufB/SufD family protein [Solirubrobacterales bacterium]